ncbi:MAG: diadenylate cyclase CdaA [Bacilli bacterium]|nr:diadenylate cyclase CdaA [Bacilli bacterium]
MTLATIWSVITKIIDISLVWLMFYYILKNIKGNVKLVLILKGIIVILIIKLLSSILNLYTVGLLLEYVIEWGPLALIVIFQPEIRGVLESLGRSQLLGRHKVLTFDERERVVYEIMEAVEYLKRNRIGALIVIERNVSLQDYITPATKVYADLTSSLLGTIFFPNSPLHDGGVIIQGDRITCAGAVFKTSMDPTINKRLGTRHRAALGIAEETDALALVVSEETGRLSIASNNELKYNLTLEDFRMALVEELKPQAEMFYDADEETEKEAGDINE